MAIYTLGSINIDHVYRVEALPRPGETVSSIDYMVAMGGKGLNMSVAAHRAGGNVRHVGLIGTGDRFVRQQIAELGLNLELISEVEAPTGHAIIYVDAGSENCIVIHGGANWRFSESLIRDALKDADPRDWLLLQNETNANEIGIKVAREKGMRIALVAAPFNVEAMPDQIGQVDLVSMNETETGLYEAAIGRSIKEIEGPDFLITYGKGGAVFHRQGEEMHVPAFSVETVDTTGAGDTFFGAFLAKYGSGAPVADAMRYGSAAAALMVQREGATIAIPAASDVEAFLAAQD